MFATRKLAYSAPGHHHAMTLPVRAGSCPTPEQLLLFASRARSDQSHVELERHVANCETCRAVLANKQGSLVTRESMASAEEDGPTVATPEASEVLDGEVNLTPPPVPQVKRPLATRTTPSLEFLSAPEAANEIGRLGSYRILQVIGTGGMGVVLKAEEISLRRLVALKVMKPLLAVHETASKRFLREARLAASVNHDNVVRVYQVGDVRGMPYLAMELLHGEPLDTKLRREGKQPILEVLRVGREVAAGLASAHRSGLIHRDIKPANIILEPIDLTTHSERTLYDSPGARHALSGLSHPSFNLDGTRAPLPMLPTTKVKIVDFGLARATEGDEELTQSGAVTGTPQYMSPEQAEGRELDSRSDLFSLGCVLYRMACGEAPFQGRSSSAVLLAVVERPHKLPREHNPDIPPQLEEIINKLLAKDPNDRFQSAIEVIQALADLEQQLAAGQSLDEDCLPIHNAQPETEQASSKAVDAASPAATSQKSIASRSKFAAMMLGLVMLAGAMLTWSRWDSVAPSKTSVETVSPKPFAKSDHLSDTTKATATDSESSTPTESPANDTHSVDESDSDVALVQPLAEWLQGRDVLTVSQDGKAQFKTIQAALDALKPNQVVKVLDQGPYRERSLYRQLPKNTGLVSSVGTRIEITEYRESFKNATGTSYSGVVLLSEAGFRLSGIDFLASQDLPTDAVGLEFVKLMGGEVTIDHCRFRFETESGVRPSIGRAGRFDIKSLVYVASAAGVYTVRISENDLRGAGLGLYQIQTAVNRRPKVLIDRNRVAECVAGLAIQPYRAAYDIRHNVIAAQRGIGFILRLGLDGLGKSLDLSATELSLANNTITADDPIYIHSVATRQTSAGPSSLRNVRIQGNILRTSTDGRISFRAHDDLGLEDLTQLRDVWRVDHNAYIGGKSLPLNFPVQPTDVELPELPLQYNADPSDANYLRPLANSRLAKAGVGGDLPAYIGALPSGSLPKDGNWFSRLRERWNSAAPAATQARVDVERRAAEWALRIGGTVRLKFPDGGLRPISALKDLPDGEFVVVEIDVHSNPRVTDADARRGVGGLSGLKSLEIHHTAITDATLEALRDSPTLTSLHLESTAVTDAGIVALGTLPMLSHLVLNRTKVTAGSLPALITQPELRSLHIGTIPASEAAAEALFATPRWNTLGLHESWIHPDYVVQLAKLPDVRALGIHGDLPISRLRLLAGLPQLTSLSFHDHHSWSPELSAGLSALPQLDSLSLLDVKPSVGWKELTTARPWRELHIGYTFLPDEFFDGIDRVDSLAKLQLTQTTQSRSRLQRFRAEHPKIDVISDTSRHRDREVAERLLRLGGIPLVVLDKTGERLVRRLEDLPDTEFQLWTIYVDDCDAFDDRMLASLAGLDSRGGLHFKKCRVTDAGLAVLDQLPSLASLEINTSQMTPLGLRTVARQSRLERLMLPTASPEQLSQLAPLKLNHLAFYNIAAEDAVLLLELVAHQFPSLTSLSVGQLAVEPSAAEILLKLTKLKMLTGQVAILSPEVIPILARHPALETLNLYGAVPQIWASLAPLQRIRRVLVGDRQLDEVFITHLAELPQLETLTFDRIKFTPKALAQLTSLRHVKQVRFNGCELTDSEWAGVVASLPQSELLWNGKPRPVQKPAQ